MRKRLANAIITTVIGGLVLSAGVLVIMSGLNNPAIFAFTAVIIGLIVILCWAINESLRS